MGVVMGADGDTEANLYRYASPNDPPSRSASQEAYKESNLGYKSNTSKWCTECHDDLKPHVAPTNNTRTKNHHLVDFRIDGLVGGELKTQPDHWVTGPTGLGFGTEQPAVTGNDTEGVPRLRFQVPGATSFATSQGVQTNAAASNQVMCGTCHLAHGGKYKKGLVWPKKDGGTDQNSGCDQCHNGQQQ